MSLHQSVNCYDKDVFNGDLGFIREIDSASGSLLVEFPALAAADKPRVVAYKGREAEELELAWATTVHKAQGGESKVVLLVLSHRNAPLLTRRLLYTGWTLLSFLTSC